MSINEYDELRGENIALRAQLVAERQRANDAERHRDERIQDKHRILREYEDKVQKLIRERDEARADYEMTSRAYRKLIEEVNAAKSALSKSAHGSSVQVGYVVTSEADLQQKLAAAETRIAQFVDAVVVNRSRDGVDGVACLICHEWANADYNLIHVARCPALAKDAAPATTTACKCGHPYKAICESTDKEGGK